MSVTKKKPAFRINFHTSMKRTLAKETKIGGMFTLEEIEKEYWIKTHGR